ncbi:MAG: GNAT family N-acetyltransferase [Rhodoglobus sp.]
MTRFAWIAGLGSPVGLAGFHGAPDDAGMVEIGYRIDPVYRRRGYARQALETLLFVAGTQPTVQIVRATISPDNRASRSLVEGYGFREVGEQWDDEDGLEMILEVSAGAASSRTSRAPDSPSLSGAPGCAPQRSTS